MSYCRWSDQDYQCDVYAYRSDRGYETFVASKRYVFSEALPDQVNFQENPAAWFERHHKVLDILDRTKMVDIGLPHDGEDWTDGEASACAERLIQLREIGYNVPQYAIDELLSEYEP